MRRHGVARCSSPRRASPHTLPARSPRFTVRPVIGVPIDAGPLRGEDALLSTVQMPGGIPVATVAIGKAGAKNAGYLAAQMLAVSDETLARDLGAERERNAAEILKRNDALQERLRER